MALWNFLEGMINSLGAHTVYSNIHTGENTEVIYIIAKVSVILTVAIHMALSTLWRFRLIKRWKTLALVLSQGLHPCDAPLYIQGNSVRSTVIA